jgi:signal transduction histidine kinase/DNA-binding NarL/FixJ family response regulator/predicted RNA-binding protein with RPS1 domain
MAQTQPIEWSKVATAFPVGTRHRGRVRKVWQVSASVELAGGLSGILRNTELDWNRQISDAREVLNPGDEVWVQILEVDTWKQRITLSLKRAVWDPWLEHSKKYTKGRVERGQVARFRRDELLIEFPDHVEGVLSRQDIPSEKAEEILETGDWVRVEVIERLEPEREIRVSMRTVLAGIERQIKERVSARRKETLNLESAPASALTQEVTAADQQDAGKGEQSTGLPPPSTRVLLVDDMDDEREELRTMLQDLGYEQTDEANGPEQAVQMATASEYDLVLMDMKMPEQDRQAGLRAARAIKRVKPNMAIALVTGDQISEEEPQSLKNDLVGIIPKPLRFDRVREAMHRFSDQGEVGWPDYLATPLQEAVPPSLKFMEQIFRASHEAKPLTETLKTILKKLAENTGATGAAVFHCNRLNRAVKMEASVGINEEDYWRCKPNLYRSPVTDLMYRPDEPIFFTDIQATAEGKFYYLRDILGPRRRDGTWPLNSCLGELVEGQLDWVYVLFLFGDRLNQFTSEHRMLLRAASSTMASAITQHWLIEQIASERKLTTLGGIISGTAHELKGKLSTMEALNDVVRAWRQLRENPAGRLNDPKFMNDMDTRVNRLESAKRGMDRVVERLLGWIREGEVARVDLKRCLESAIETCREEAWRNEVVVDLEWDHVPAVLGNAVELEHVFLNLLLNAVHHMKGCKRRGGVVTIRTEQEIGAKLPVKVRFSDTGPGIHSRFLDTTLWPEERIFHPLFTTKSKGTGMGLYIARGLLANMGGGVRVERTEMFAGTTFLVELPA